MFASLFSLIPLIALVSASPIAERQYDYSGGSLITSGRNPNLCLSVAGGMRAVETGSIINGTPVVSMPCNEASHWDIAKGSGRVVVTGTDFNLDLGITPGNHGNVWVWLSQPYAPQQTWYLTDDNRIAHTGGTQCLDQGDDRVQTYQCGPDNNNQVWNVAPAGPIPMPLPSFTTQSGGPGVTASHPVVTSQAPEITISLPAITSESPVVTISHPAVTPDCPAITISHPTFTSMEAATTVSA